MAYLLILGARSDMAKALAHRFAKEGFDLYLAARRHEELEQDIKDLTIRYQITARAVEFDLLNFSKHESFYSGLREEPAGVICVVGYLGEQCRGETDFSEARRIIDTNYTGCVSILNIVATNFMKRGSGFIIGISSVAGDRGRQSNYIYGSAKAAFTAYLSGLRARLYKKNVSVITVKPGFVRTNMTEGMNLPDKLTAEPDEVAEDIFYAWKKGKNSIYTRWYWRYIMIAIRSIPESIFKRLSF